MTPDIEAQFSQCYDAHCDSLYRFALYRTGDSSLAEEIVSESFMRLFGRFESYSDAEHITRSLYTICRNIIIDHQRKHNKLSSLDESTYEVADNSLPDQYESIQKIDNQKALLDLLDLLSESDRAIIVDHAINQKDYRELSEIHQKPEPTIRKMYSRALERLAKHAQKKYEQFN